jgi:DNA invertase Pin-like site-specific DNA recombinase
MARTLAERQRAHEQSKARLAEAKLKLDERRQRTRRLIEAGALVEKAALLELDSNALYGAPLSLRDGADNPKRVEQWAVLGGRAFLGSLSRGIAVTAKPVRKKTFVKDSKSKDAGLLLGYARVSKGDDQTNILQTKALRAAGCRRLFEEAASGGRWDRPELHRPLDQLRDGDTVVVWKLDRLSRSLKDVLRIMERIAKAGAGFRSITENIDTTTPAGRMMMQMVGAFAEFERAMIRERTSAGLAAARAEGRIGGRRKKLDAGKRREIAESVISGRKSGADMARLYNISAPTVSRIVAQHRTAPA